MSASVQASMHVSVTPAFKVCLSSGSGNYSPE